MPGADDAQCLIATRPGFFRHGDLQGSGQVLARQTALDAGDLVRGAGGHDFAAANSGTRAKVDDQIGGPHRVFVVLDDDDRVAHVAQMRERVEQAIVVAGMQADRWFVEDVEDANETAADLAGQADALRFAARERRGGAAERQIVEPDVEQKAEPAANLFKHFGGDRLACFVELQLIK